jgi:hypothetical protein
MRLPKPWFRTSKNAWFVEHNGVQVRLGLHPENAPAPKKSKAGWNPPKEIQDAFYKLMARDPATMPKVQDIFTAQVPTRMAMTRLATPIILASLLALSGYQPTAAQEKPTTLEALKAEIEALKAAKPAWREIAWKSCLLEGLKESREKKKPVLLWIFIDRPIDDARC